MICYDKNGARIYLGSRCSFVKDTDSVTGVVDAIGIVSYPSQNEGERPSIQWEVKVREENSTSTLPNSWMPVSKIEVL